MANLDEVVVGEAFLFDVEARFRKASMDYHKKQEILLRFFHLQNKFNMLPLVVERIKDEIKFLKATMMNTKRYFHFLIDLEAYFYLLISTLDILAKLTPHFYSEWEGDKNTRRYFSHQKDFFRQNPDKDPEYARYLNNGMEWFEKAKTHRNQLTHNGALIIFPSSNKKYYFGTKRNKKGFIPNEEVQNCIEKTYEGFCNFLLYYNSHFGIKLIGHDIC